MLRGGERVAQHVCLPLGCVQHRRRDPCVGARKLGEAMRWRGSGQLVADQRMRGSALSRLEGREDLALLDGGRAVDRQLSAIRLDQPQRLLAHQRVRAALGGVRVRGRREHLSVRHARTRQPALEDRRAPRVHLGSRPLRLLAEPDAPVVHVLLASGGVTHLLVLPRLRQLRHHHRVLVLRRGQRAQLAEESRPLGARRHLGATHRAH
mmetsp:Transcript_9518/g.24649  ORF Transcript_9518/g.24649 Transcript_9518/m.24649 type:complete len:208 (-) Transcript_9518:193-816(-)